MQIRRLLSLSVTLAAAAGLYSAAAIDVIVAPSRGGGMESDAPMVHIDVMFDAGGHQLSVLVDTNYARPRLRPMPSGYTLDVTSHYRVMVGKAYNYQYAWNPGGLFAPPTGAAIWIECLDATPGLETYDGPGNKMENPPRSYAPIFGTAGSPRIWKWYGRMAHNTYAIRNPVTNLITAQYRVYIGDAESGSRDAYQGYPEASVTLAWDIDSPVFVTPKMGGGQSQGEMLHIDVTYDESSRSLQAHVEETRPELLPLAAGQAFEPTQKYAVLNGRNYNAQYGWNIGAYFQLPAGAGLWIEQTSASAGLEVYEGSGLNAQYAPIFGTSGSSCVWKWSGVMTHNTYALLNPGRDSYYAQYRVFVGDAETGSREGFEDITEAQVKLNWHTVPSAFPPVLKIDSLSCKTECITAYFKGEAGRKFILESTTALGAEAVWQRVAGPLAGEDAVQTLEHRSFMTPLGFYRIASEEGP